MEVILIKDLKRKGSFGDVINVADGYARNYLIPKGFAMAANTANKKRFSEIKDKALEEVNKVRNSHQGTAKKIKGSSFTIVALSRDGKLYGSISPSLIVKTIKDEYPDLSINASDIIVEDGNIKYVGTYACKVQFTKDIFSDFTLIIESDESDEQPELLEALMEPDKKKSMEEDSTDNDVDNETTSDNDKNDDDTVSAGISEVVATSAATEKTLISDETAVGDSSDDTVGDVILDSKESGAPPTDTLTEIDSTEEVQTKQKKSTKSTTAKDKKSTPTKDKESTAAKDTEHSVDEEIPVVDIADKDADHKID